MEKIGRDVVLAGDAAGVVAPASGEGIFHCMTGGLCAEEAIEQALVTGNPKALRQARRRCMRPRGSVFAVLDVMQYVRSINDDRRERFVAMPTVARRRTMRRGEPLDAQAMMLLEVFARAEGRPPSSRMAISPEQFT